MRWICSTTMTMRRTRIDRRHQSPVRTGWVLPLVGAASGVSALQVRGRMSRKTVVLAATVGEAVRWEKVDRSRLMSRPGIETGDSGDQLKAAEMRSGEISRSNQSKT